MSIEQARADCLVCLTRMREIVDMYEELVEVGKTSDSECNVLLTAISGKELLRAMSNVGQALVTTYSDFVEKEFPKDDKSSDQ